MKAVTIAFAALTALAAPAAAEPFRLIVTDLETPLVPNSVMDLADRLGYYQREGVEVELVRVQQTPSALAALMSGDGEMANISTDALLQRIAGGADDLRAVASPNKSLPFLIAAREGLAGPADLAGKTFGVGRIGSLDHSLSSKVLEAAGTSMDKMEILTLGQPAVRAQALLAGQVDATTMSIGTFTSLPDRTGIHVLIDADAYYAAAPVVTKVNVVTLKVLETRRADVEAVLTALTKASRDFAADPKVWVDAMVAARPDIPRATLEGLAENYAKSWSINGGLQKGELAYTEDWLYQGSDFKDLARIPMDGWVDFDPIDAVLGKLGTGTGMDAVSR